MNFPTGKISIALFTMIAVLAIVSCKKDKPDPIPPPPPPTEQQMPVACQSADQAPGPDGPGLVFKFRFNDQQVRLGSFGQPVGIPQGNAGQSPSFNSISAHYIELAPNALTALGTGDVLFVGTETTVGGDTALDFDQAITKSECEDFIRIPFSEITPGTYEWIRVSLAYQNYDIQFRFSGNDYTGTLASFIGFNTYITSYNINTQSMDVNENKLQGYWGFETTLNFLGIDFTETATGQAPEGATTVPNPLFDSSPIPSGSCVVTGPFGGGSLEITGNETEDIVVVLSLSTNKSFEWIDINGDGKYEPLNSNFEPTGEVPVDMGVRGLEVIVNP
jgi:hypothetical protein